MLVSMFRDVRDRSPVRTEIELTRFMEHEVRNQKEGSCWSPAIYCEGLTRANKNVKAVSALVLDFDCGVPPEELEARWKEYEYVIHSTHSSRLDCPKYRAIFQLSEPASAEEFMEAWPKAALILGSDLCDLSCKDPARLYYLPSCSPEGSADKFARRHEGRLLDLAALPDMGEHRGATRKTDPAIATFNSETPWEELLEPNGWTKTGRTWNGQTLWARPGKDIADGHSAKTGDGGRGDLFYCFSSNSPLPPNQAMDKFKVFTELSFGGDRRKALRSLEQDGASCFDKSPGGAQAERQFTEIRLDQQERDIVEQAAAALLGSPCCSELFVFNGGIVKVMDIPTRPARIEPVDAAQLRNLLSSSIDWVRYGPNGRKPAPLREDIARCIGSALLQALPCLEGIVSAPYLRPDGRLRLVPGYDPSAKLYGSFPEGIEIPAESAEASARYLLDEILSDFPFKSESDRTAALALLILPFFLPFIGGPTPLCLACAPAPATGKTLLIKSCLQPYCEREPAAMSGALCEEEQRKTIDSISAAGTWYAIFDNVARKIDSPSLAARLTTTSHRYRPLGSSRVVESNRSVVWTMTANNPELSDEMARRTVLIELDAMAENPGARRGFRHPNLLSWVSQNRREVLGRIANIARAWVEAGMPEGKAQMASFEQYASVLGGALEVAGVSGFLAGRSEAGSARSFDAERWGAFFERWFARDGEKPAKASELAHLFEQDDYLAGILDDRSQLKKVSSLGRLLRKKQGAVIGGLCLEIEGKSHNALMYCLRRTQPKEG